MDRRDYTIDWYRKQDFQRPHSGSFEKNKRVNGKGYAPSDFGDYRRGHIEKSLMPNSNDERIPGRGYSGHRYAPSDTGDYRENSPPMEPSPDYITGVPVLPQNHAASHPYKRAISDARHQQGIPLSGETFYNRLFEPDERQQFNVYDQPYTQRPRPETTSTYLRTEANQGDSFIIYDGKDYKESTSLEKPRPTWVDKMVKDDDEKKKTKKTSNMVCTLATVSRIVVMTLIVWDLSNDWLLASSGPISFLNSDESTATCQKNTKVFNLTRVNISLIDDYICSKSKNVWNAFGVLSLLGSLVSIIQLINIGCEMLMQCRSSVFQVLHGQSEVLLALFFEELPQISLMTSLLYICDCSEMSDTKNGLPHPSLTMLLASISAAASTTARFSTSFGGIAEDGGCCNTWWRSSCCENKNYCCRLNPKNLFCICNIPCPLCCCTLHCKMCKWTPRTWCSPLLKAFSCFYDCCRDDEDMFGVRLINILGIFLLWGAVGVNILIYVASMM